MNVTNHKYIESYWVEELPNGVIHLLINCTQKEIYFHAYSEHTFLICGTEEEFEDFNLDLVFDVPEMIDFTKDTLYIQTTTKNKEQLSFYYIPYQKEWIKQRKFLVK